MRNRTKVPIWIMTVSIICLSLGVFTRLPWFIFGIAGFVGTIIGWVLYMRVRNDDLSDVVIDAKFTEEKKSKKTTEPMSFDERLRKIELLKQEGLITESEYQYKRAEIMRDKW